MTESVGVDEWCAMSNARSKALESCRLLVVYSTNSTAPVRTISLRDAFGFGPKASTVTGSVPSLRSWASRSMPALLSKSGPATNTSKGPNSRTSSITSVTLELVTTWYSGPSDASMARLSAGEREMTKMRCEIMALS